MYFARATPKSAIMMVASTGLGNDHKAATQDRRQQNSTRVCFRWNSCNGCQLVACKFLHCCVRCRNTSHTALGCPQQRPNPPPPCPQEQLSQETNFRPPFGRRQPNFYQSAHTNLTRNDSCSNYTGPLPVNTPLLINFELDNF